MKILNHYGALSFNFLEFTSFGLVAKLRKNKSIRLIIDWPFLCPISFCTFLGFFLLFQILFLGVSQILS